MTVLLDINIILISEIKSIQLTRYLASSIAILGGLNPVYCRQINYVLE